MMTSTTNDKHMSKPHSIDETVLTENASEFLGSCQVVNERMNMANNLSATLFKQTGLPSDLPLNAMLLQLEGPSYCFPSDLPLNARLHRLEGPSGGFPSDLS
jgi:hypothetical protein